MVSYGGSLSGEHGDGQARGELLARMYSPEIIEAFREFKSIWDPDWKMNPGKGDRSIPRRRKPARRHLLQPAARCRRISIFRTITTALRRQPTGASAPASAAVTRARDDVPQLHGHARGEALDPRPSAPAERDDPRRVVKGGWRDEAVREALDLCLSCKGCKHDCPVQVDMATYKAEFLSHYYERRLRPRYAYASGLIYWWARAAAHMPATANFFTQTPGLNQSGEAGCAAIPRSGTFRRSPRRHSRQWFARRGRTQRR